MPFVLRKHQQIRARRVHLVRLPRVNRFLLHRLNLQRLEFLIQHLRQIQYHRLVKFLPQMRTEQLNQTDLERWQFPMHKTSRQIELDLETDVNVASIESRTPPQRKSTIGDLIETRPLSIGQFLELHTLLKSRLTFPEQSLPRGESRTLEQCMIENRFNSAESLNDVRTVRIEIVEFPVVTLISPPERILTCDRELFEFLTDTPSRVER